MSSESPSVFVVEDEPEMRESFAALFTSHELAVELFSSGEAFIERYNPSRPGCIVTDFRLQGINGIDLHRLLAETGCTLPVILISGYLNVRSAVNAISHGIYRVLRNLIVRMNSCLLLKRRLRRTTSLERRRPTG